MIALTPCAAMLCSDEVYSGERSPSTVLLYGVTGIVRWTGKIEAGRVSDLLFHHPDVPPPLAEMTGSNPPADIDGLSQL